MTDDKSLWRAVDSLGGTFPPDQAEYGRGYTQALNDVIAELERRGFRDTGDWPVLNAQQRARDYEAAASAKHALYAAARDTAYTMTYVEGDADILNAVADEISCGGNEHQCEYCSWEPDTNATNCSRDDRADDAIGCRFYAASQLREMAKALNWLAESRKRGSDATYQVAALSEPREAEGEQP